MTKKWRVRFARALRWQGFDWSASHKIAKMVHRAGGPWGVSDQAWANVGVDVFDGTLDDFGHHWPRQLLGPAGQDVMAAWRDFVAA